MGGTFNIGGLISGLDTNNIVRQLVALERQPITRLEGRITGLRAQQNALRDLRTVLQTLRSRSQDFRFSGVFNQFAARSSNEDVLSASIAGTSTAAAGTYSINVQQLASATTAVSGAPLGAAVNPNAAISSAGFGTAVESGTFTINGVQFNVNPATQSLNTILGTINAGGAGVIATYSAITDTVTFENATPNDTSLINFGATDDTSNILQALNVVGATQTTGAGGSTVVSSMRNLGAVNPQATLNTVNFAGGPASAGSFSINGVTINVDPTTDSISSVLQRINSSDARVNASYDASSDTIRVVSTSLGSRTINFSSGTSNFLDVTNLTAATQTAGNDAQFTINGGPVQTRNSNEIANAIGGVTFNLLSTGSSVITVENDNEAVLEQVRSFVEAFNDSVQGIRGLIGENGRFENDVSIRVIENTLRAQIFGSVPGLTGPFSNLLEVGLSTGSSFDASSVSLLELDEEAFLAALAQDRTGVAALFANEAGEGIGDRFEAYLESITNTQGFLNQRARGGGSIDETIRRVESQIERINRRATNYELRLRAQFSRLEQLSANFQQAGASLLSLTNGFGGLSGR